MPLLGNSAAQNRKSLGGSEGELATLATAFYMIFPKGSFYIIFLYAYCWLSSYQQFVLYNYYALSVFVVLYIQIMVPSNIS